MLTYDIGHAGPPHSGLAMARHLGTATITEHLAMELAQYGLDAGLVAGRTVGIVRSDTHPALKTLLGLGPEAPHEWELAALLRGWRTDADPISGSVARRPSKSLAQALGLRGERAPTPDEIARMLGSERADGAGPLARPDSARRRLLALYGIPRRHEPTPHELAAVLDGRRADGREVNEAHLVGRLTREPSRIAYLDLQFHADKSVSVAVALARGAERALLVAAHLDAADDAMHAVAPSIGRMRRGDGDRTGLEAAHVTWLKFQHFTARPTNVDRNQRAIADGTVGDPHLHAVYVIPHAILTKDGVVGSLDLSGVLSRVHAVGAIYQCCVARRLRQIGVEVRLDEATGAARVAAIDEDVRDRFSIRTIAGTAKARRRAEETGLVWEQMSEPHRRRSIKLAIQGDPASARSDDLADVATWRERYGHVEAPPIVPDATGRHPALGTRETRIARAADLARDLVAKETDPREAPSAHTAAARALIAFGMEDLEEVERVASRLRASGSEADRTAQIRLKVKDGSARLVDGGRAAYAEAIASTWSQIAGSGSPIPVAARTREEADILTEVIRRNAGVACRPQTTMTVEGIEGELRTLRVTSGDLVRIARPLNVAGADGHGGRIGGAGSVLRIVEVLDAGIRLASASGRQGLAKWSSLYDRDTGTYALDYAYLRVGRTFDSTSPCIETALGGISTIGPGRLHPESHLILNRNVEAAAGRHDDDAIWEAVADRLADDDPTERLDGRLRELEIATASIPRKAALVLERGGSLARSIAHRRIGKLVSVALARMEQAARGADRRAERGNVKPLHGSLDQRAGARQPLPSDRERSVGVVASTRRRRSMPTAPSEAARLSTETGSIGGPAGLREVDRGLGSSRKEATKLDGSGSTRGFYESLRKLKVATTSIAESAGLVAGASASLSRSIGSRRVARLVAAALTQIESTLRSTGDRTERRSTGDRTERRRTPAKVSGAHRGADGHVLNTPSANAAGQRQKVSGSSDEARSGTPQARPRHRPDADAIDNAKKARQGEPKRPRNSQAGTAATATAALSSEDAHHALIKRKRRPEDPAFGNAAIQREKRPIKTSEAALRIFRDLAVAERKLPVLDPRQEPQIKLPEVVSQTSALKTRGKIRVRRKIKRKPAGPEL